MGFELLFGKSYSVPLDDFYLGCLANFHVITLVISIYHTMQMWVKLFLSLASNQHCLSTIACAATHFHLSICRFQLLHFLASFSILCT